MTLCENCLETIESDNRPGPTPVGPDQGNQRDPYRVHRTLCAECRQALLDGRWDIINKRYREERKVIREGV